MIEIKQPEKIQNLDILDLVYRIDRFLQELQECPSATRNESAEPDRGRWRALQDDLKRKFEIYKGKPELDLPKYHPNSRPLPEPPVLDQKQNVDIMNLSQTLIAVRTEMVFGGAAEKVNGFSVKQAERVEKALERIDILLDDIDKNPEVDSPNSADEKPARGMGRVFGRGRPDLRDSPPLETAKR